MPDFYGVVTTGSIRRFLKLRGKTVWLDLPEYYLERVDKILGILHHIVTDTVNDGK